jgi:hypothetical protein
VDIISDLSRIRTLLSENTNKNSDEKDILMELLTFLLPDHSVYNPDTVYLDSNSDEYQRIYIQYSVNKEHTILEKEESYDDDDVLSTEYRGTVYLTIEKLNILDKNKNILVEDADWYDIPEYIFEEFEGDLGSLCYKYGLSVDFDYIVKD